MSLAHSRAALCATLLAGGIVACGTPQAIRSSGPAARTAPPAATAPEAAPAEAAPFIAPTGQPIAAEFYGQVLVRHAELWRTATVVGHPAPDVVRVRYDNGHLGEYEDLPANRLIAAVLSAGQRQIRAPVVVAVAGGPSAPATVLAFFDAANALVRFGPAGSWNGSHESPRDWVVPVAQLSDEGLTPEPSWMQAAADGTMSPIMQEPRPDGPREGDPIWVWYRGAYVPAVRGFADGSGLVVHFRNGNSDSLSQDFVIPVPPPSPERTSFAAGDAVYIEWNHLFFDGTVRVRASKAEHYRVHYARTPPTAEAEVHVQRLRPRTPL